MFKRLILIAVLTLVTVLGSVMISTPEAVEASTGCSAFYADIPVSGTTTIFSIPLQFEAGEILFIGATGDPGTQHVSVNGVNSGYFPVGYYWAYEIPATGVYEIIHWISVNVEGSAKAWWRCGSFEVGCEVPYPSTAVVGEITDNAAIFQMADPNTMTSTVLELGKTFWMDGLDSTGMYRKVWVGCAVGWVEASKTGPNFDEVWNGTPLPSHTVN